MRLQRPTSECYFTRPLQMLLDCSTRAIVLYSDDERPPGRVSDVQKSGNDYDVLIASAAAEAIDHCAGSGISRFSGQSVKSDIALSATPICAYTPAAQG
jgi:hypothetical protein